MLGVVLPLRLSVHVNLREQLTQFLDASHSHSHSHSQSHSHSHSQHSTRTHNASGDDVDGADKHIYSYECQDDLERLDTLRKKCLAAIQAGYVSEAAVALAQTVTLQEYAAALLECELHNFPITDNNDNDKHKHKQYLAFTWNNETHGNLRWERANIIWNIIALTAHQAVQACHANHTINNNNDQTEALTLMQSKGAWAVAGKYLEKAAALAHYLRTKVLSHDTSATDTSLSLSSTDTVTYSSPSPLSPSLFTTTTAIHLQPSFLQVWQDLLLATAQRAAYQAFACTIRPRHFMLAKLAAAAAPLYHQTEEECQALISSIYISSSSSISISGSSDHQQVQQQQQLQQQQQHLQHWNDSVRAWGMWMSCLAEHHQSVMFQEKQDWGLELARLDQALKYARLTAQFVHDSSSGSHNNDNDNGNGMSHNNDNNNGDSPMLDALQQQVETMLPKMELRMRQATSDNDAQHHAVIPHRQDLPEIPPQLTVNVHQAIDKLLPANKQPLFTNRTDPAVRQLQESFQAEMDRLFFSSVQTAEEKTESGKKALAMVNLPHALTAYRQKVAGGGIPDELWSRVEAVQHDGRIQALQRELWDLRDAAEAARSTYHQTEQLLEEDLEMDSLFRQQHVSFEGHDVGQVQNTFRQSLQNYDRLLAAARDGDTVLLKRLEILDTDPKYKLLQFQKSQLDRLLPGASSVAGRGSGGAAAAEFDVSDLSRYLVELSTLFNEREAMLRQYKDEVQSLNIAEQFSRVSATGPDAEREYQHIMNAERDSFHFRAREMQSNVDAQTNLIRTILDENRLFMLARDASQVSSSSDSCIVMIEDAIEEIEQLSKHLQEGSDFYKVIVPKLERLKQQVEDVSARLTIERCEYEDKTSRQQQESEDARMAATFGNSSSHHSNGPRSGGAPTQSQSSSRRVDPVGSRPGGSRDEIRRLGMLPGVEAVSHSEPVVYVDDEKVASLVAMDFDPDKVVAALKRCDNNIEQALNELLAC